MQSKQEGQYVIARLKSGDNYIEFLHAIAKEHDIKAGFILSSIGMLKDVELGFFLGNGKYKINKFKEPVEVTSVQGNFAMMDNELKTHLHITLSDEDGKAYGGHLDKGIVWVTADILILKLDKIKMTRKMEEDTGLAGLNLE